MKKGEIKTYAITKQRGIDDLLNEYAFRILAQGSHDRSNDVKWADDDWFSFMFGGIDKYDQEAINAESRRRHEENLRYIERLKAEGRYGEEYKEHLNLKHYPEFDDPKAFSRPLVGQRFYFIDTSGNTKTNTDD